MSLLLALCIGLTIGAGLHLTMSRDLLRVVIGLSLIGSGANLTVLSAGGIRFLAPPIVPDDATVLHATADPLPQALVLTAIVIGFALVCLSIVLMLAVRAASNTDDIDALRASEPEDGSDGKPAILKD
ncbi:NADH-quinone oxidoreductase subunit K [Silanimonas sp.]|uniref:sodium:proton antiporter n=1 Tax=Silanimonas sp. TaxID=1929290 RepID=UPI001BC59F0A|nr:NADH-quinone oxidoreductase subunit K [Silanimonas sp.]MBS3895697.1 NADH-quinone oxidoreductase subunit K [Silanimonas sp.]MBS3924384.1 NADH-quinone oxidoreductase subunit K [Xanthomonadaceae bacterium]